MKKDTAFTMRYSQEDAERLNDLAKKMKRSRSDVLRLIVSEALEAISAAQQSVQRTAGRVPNVASKTAKMSFAKRAVTSDPAAADANRSTTLRSP